MAKSRRLELHKRLVDLTGWNVYFQPPENIKLKYPCVIYELSTGKDLFADNKSYLFTDCYSVKLIHREADSEMPEVMRQGFQYISRGSRYVSDNLYHDLFTLYF